MFYVGFAEDRTCFTVKLAEDWVQVRHYQCRMLADVLLENKMITNAMHDAIMHGLEKVLEWVLEHRQEASNLALGSASLWVAVMAQQQIALVSKRRWAFESQDMVDKWSLKNLYEHFKQNNSQVSKCAQRFHHIVCTQFENCDKNIKEVETLSKILSMQANCNSKTRRCDEKVLASAFFDGIQQCKRALCVFPETRVLLTE